MTKYEEMKNYLKDYIQRSPENFLSVHLVGDPGSGKSHLIREVAEELDIPVYALEGNPTVCNEDLTGYWSIESGSVEYNDGPVLKTIERANKNGVALLEISDVNLMRSECLFPIMEAIGQPHCVRYPYYEPHNEKCLEDDAKMILVLESTSNQIRAEMDQLPKSLDNKIDMKLDLGDGI